MRILYAVHALPAAGLGGTELYTRRLAETLARDHEVAVATPRGHETDVLDVDVYALPDPVDWTDPSGQASGVDSGVAHEPVDRRFGDVLDAFDPDVVHLQHLKFLSATLPTHCRERGIPRLLTLHDFWTTCHREQLIQPSGALCNGPESVAKCASCYVDAVEQAEGATTDAVEHGDETSTDLGARRRAVERRTERLREARAACDLLIAPSAFLRERFVAFGTPPERIVHRRNGIRIGAFADTGFDDDGPLRIGYAGRITHRKGVHVLLEAFRRVDGDTELHVFGTFSPESDAYHARLRERADDHVTFHGRYEAVQAPYVVSDVLVVPSLWYENSPLVIQEAFASGVPVVTGDIGGMAELVDDGCDGLTYPVGDAAALADRLRVLVGSPETVRRLRAGVDPPKSIDEHAQELLDLYAACRDNRDRTVDPVP